MNHKRIVVVADGTRARLFTLEKSALPAVESSPYLHECEDMVNPEHRQASRDKYSTTRTGFNTSPHSGPRHYDDHRIQQEQEHERRFACAIAAHAVALAHGRNANHIVLAAEKHMLGLLRGALEIPAGSDIQVLELDKDLTRLAPQALQEQLAAYGILPKRHLPGS